MRDRLRTRHADHVEDLYATAALFTDVSVYVQAALDAKGDGEHF